MSWILHVVFKRNARVALCRHLPLSQPENVVNLKDELDSPVSKVM